VAKLPGLLEELLAAPAAKVSNHPTIPEVPGIYLFSEPGEHGEEKAIYVGQTRKLRSRLKNHTRLGGKNNQATFAFLVAKTDAQAAGVNTKQYREVLERDEDFIAHFDGAKSRVVEMGVRFILLDGPIERSLFEIYAAMALDTLVYNSFETH
jgi:GIY-YIG catalytic domain